MVRHQNKKRLEINFRLQALLCHVNEASFEPSMRARYLTVFACMRDIGLPAAAFGSYPDHPRWNPVADINKDNTVDMRDIVTVARNFGKTA